MKKVAILGSTGSIGVNALQVIKEYPEEFQVSALSAGQNLDLLYQQILDHKPSLVSVKTAELAVALKERLQAENLDLAIMPQIVFGENGLLEVARDSEAQIVLTAIVGVRGLEPTLAAIESGKDIALANKEPLVAAGHLVTAAARKSGSKLLPVDSEHSAIFQCLRGENIDEVKKLILTSSGGPFRTVNRLEMEKVTVADALRHPTWSMGAKITIDSATLMNKGLEVIEAYWLFGVPFGKIDVLVHPQSLIHSMVEYMDGSTIAQISTTDMRVPIQLALSFPRRLQTSRPSLDFAKVGTLTFEEPDRIKFPCLTLCYQAGETGGSAPAVLNAANEAANSLFLENRIPFLGIENLLQRVMDLHKVQTSPMLEELFMYDKWARHEVFNLAAKLY